MAATHTVHTDDNGRRYVIVVKGDTLSSIALECLGSASKFTTLAAINDIPDHDLIIVGQKIYLDESTNSTPPSYPEVYTPVITYIGFQSNTDKILVRWECTRTDVKHYDLRWFYGTDDGIAYADERYTDDAHAYTENKYHVYDPPGEAKRVIFQVKVWANNSTSGAWSAQAKFELSNRAPDKPGKPSVSVNDYTLTATLTGIAAGVDTIEFRLYKNDSYWVPPAGIATVKTDAASYAFTIASGNRYKVQCRACNAYGVSEWSGYTDNYESKPNTPESIISIRAASETAVYLNWTQVSGAETYDIQYAINRDYLDDSNMATIVSTETSSTQFTIGNLTTGFEYFFRVRAKHSKNGASEWSEVKSVRVGTAPAPPTTWSSTNVAIRGESIVLYWLHNTEDGSDQTFGELEYSINGQKYLSEFTTQTEYVFDTSPYSEGATVWWRVRTAGVTHELSEWSTARSFNIVAPATLDLIVTDFADIPIETLTTFPIRVRAIASPNTQKPIGYSIVVTSNQAYETTDYLGNPLYINKGAQVYSNHIDGPAELSLDISAGDIILENNMSYTITCTVAMDSGLTAESYVVFTVAWKEVLCEPRADIIFDNELYVAHIRPFCEKTTYTRYKVNEVQGSYVVSSDIIGSVFGELVDKLTTTGEQVYYGTTGSGEKTYYCEIRNATAVEDVVLSVYRREFDGSFTEIMTNIDNKNNVHVTDPHPSLDYARYRIVATHTPTGAVSYYDQPGYEVNCKHMILQWDEEWTYFDYDDNGISTQLPWSGSMVKLKANIDVSEQTSRDVSLINYIGRKHPVVYHGTQVGGGGTWTAVIQKSDKETLYALRRLAIWMGKVYVREPSGIGYWADVNVSFSQKHNDLTIPVSLDITRVEGGI